MSELGHRTINVCKNGSEPEKCESLERCSHSIDGGWVPKAMLELATNLEWQHLSGFPIIPASRSVTLACTLIYIPTFRQSFLLCFQGRDSLEVKAHRKITEIKDRVQHQIYCG